MKATDVVAYTFRAATYHPGCILGQLPTSEGEAFDGWKLTPGVRMTVEDNLTEVADAFGIDRMDEHTFDSADFPKVVFASQVEEPDETCGACQKPLID